MTWDSSSVRTAVDLIVALNRELAKYLGEKALQDNKEEAGGMGLTRFLQHRALEGMMGHWPHSML